MSKKKRGTDYNVARAADLEASGLGDPKIVKRLKFGDVLDPEATGRLTGLDLKKHRAVAYEIPYFDVDGRQAEYSRWKLISLDDKELPMKYYQEDKTIPRVYLPPLTDWQAVAADANRRIVVTEGEKKAACACMHGIPTVGLGGVWNWKSKKWGYEEIPDFELINWRGRIVEICFDGDMTSNENVNKALIALTSALLRRGSKVYVRRLPKTGGKAALDDFLVANGAEAYDEVQMEEAPQSKQLSDLNSKLAYVTKLNAFVALEDGALFKNEADVHRRFGTHKMIGESGKSVPACSVWCTWEHRLELDDIVYEPGRPPLYDGRFNVWRDDGAKAVKGDVSSFLEVLSGVEKWEWLLQWLAYPVQNPGAKLHTAVVLWSVEQRTGKTLLGDVMSDIYGKSNSSKIMSDNLEDASNEWIARKQFVLGDEIMQSAGRAEMGVLKSMITGDTVHVNIKYVPKYTVQNRANFYLTSNQPDAIRLDRTDRRFFIGSLTQVRSEKFWNDVTKWRRAGGASAFRYYLENEVDLAKFDPHASAPHTVDKIQMAYTAMGAFDQWCADLIASPETMFGDTAKVLRGRDVFTVSQLMNFLPDELRPRANAAVLGKALLKAGAVAAYSPVRTGDGKVRRLLAIKNLDRWHAARSEKYAWANNFDNGGGEEDSSRVVKMRVVDPQERLSGPRPTKKATVTRLRPKGKVDGR